jgi:DNA polymerase III delta prime subunit
VIEFSTTKKNLAPLASKFMERLKFILKNEGVQYEDKVLAELIIRFAPDWRRVINECQRYSVSGVIDSGILVNIKDESIQNLMKILKDKDFPKMRKWVSDHIDIDTTGIFRKIFDSISDYAKPPSVPQVILILADYQYKSAFVSDHELNIVACLTEIMANTQWN